MSHQTEIVQYKNLSDGQIAVLLRCCKKPITDHWHTMAVSVAADPQKLADSINAQFVTLEARHDDSLQAEKELDKLMRKQNKGNQE